MRAGQRLQVSIGDSCWTSPQGSATSKTCSPGGSLCANLWDTSAFPAKGRWLPVWIQGHVWHYVLSQLCKSHHPHHHPAPRGPLAWGQNSHLKDKVVLSRLPLRHCGSWLWACQFVDTCLPVSGLGPWPWLMYQHFCSISRALGQKLGLLFTDIHLGSSLSRGAVGQTSLMVPVCRGSPALTAGSQRLVPVFLTLGVTNSTAENWEVLIPFLFVFHESLHK